MWPCPLPTLLICLPPLPHALHADVTVVSVQVALGISIQLTAESPFAGCGNSTSQQASLLEVGAEGGWGSEGKGGGKGYRREGMWRRGQGEM